MSDEQFDRAIEYARAEGERAGRSAAGWMFDGNTPTETYTRVLRGLKAGDPAVLDTLPSPDLSGQWADTLTGPQLFDDALAEANVVNDEHVDEWFTDVCDAYETAFSEAAETEIERVALEMHTHEGNDRSGPPLGAPLPTCVLCGVAYMNEDDDPHEFHGGAAGSFASEGCTECIAIEEDN